MTSGARVCCHHKMQDFSSHLLNERTDDISRGSCGPNYFLHQIGIGLRKMLRKLTYLTILVLAIVAFNAFSTIARSACREVRDDKAIQISNRNLRDLSGLGIDRKLLFEIAKEISIPETSGCWGGATGNFDSQILSLGIMQWNYGQRSLQPVLLAVRKKFTEDQFREFLQQTMPRFGRLIFSRGCLRYRNHKRKSKRLTITDECKRKILSEQHSDGKLKPPFRDELDALFESDAMLQVQMDRVIRAVLSVEDDLQRLFNDENATPRRVKWAIDTKTQQGSFPTNENISRMRLSLQRRIQNSRHEPKASTLAIIDWYGALCRTADQDGIRLDCQFNLRNWRAKVICSGISDEEVDLLHLTFLRSRVSVGEGGRWQALTFQRRAKIILGLGSVAGHKLGRHRTCDASKNNKPN